MGVEAKVETFELARRASLKRELNLLREREQLLDERLSGFYASMTGARDAVRKRDPAAFDRISYPKRDDVGGTLNELRRVITRIDHVRSILGGEP